jgi:excisionase family DNA binding protein
VNSLAAAVLDALRDDPGALACLRELVGIQPAPKAEAQWYTVRSLATALGVSEKVVRNAIARDELQAVKRGARWYIQHDAVERWLGTAVERAVGGPLMKAFAAYDRRAA